MWFLVVAHVYFWPGPDVEIEPPDAKTQQQAIDHAGVMAVPPGCRGLFSGCEPWVTDA